MLKLVGSYSMTDVRYLGGRPGGIGWPPPGPGLDRFRSGCWVAHEGKRSSNHRVLPIANGVRRTPGYQDKRSFSKLSFGEGIPL